jgi:hypothetical protein
VHGVGEESGLVVQPFLFVGGVAVRRRRRGARFVDLVMRAIVEFAADERKSSREVRRGRPANSDS